MSQSKIPVAENYICPWINFLITAFAYDNIFNKNCSMYRSLAGDAATQTMKEVWQIPDVFFQNSRAKNDPFTYKLTFKGLLWNTMNFLNACYITTFSQSNIDWL